MQVRIGWALGLSLVCAQSVSIAQSLSFSDRTAASGVQFTRNITTTGLENRMGGGCVGDFNNDGWQDLFVLGGDQPDKLFINQRDGTFTDQAAAWGVAVTHVGSGAIAVDYNKDGWTDIYVTSIGPRGATTISQHKLYRNRGNGSFENVATSAGLHRTSTVVPDGFGATFGDYDLDGDLDCAVAGWILNNSGANRVFRNNGNNTYTDVSVTVTVPRVTMTTMQGFSPRFIDTDGDRYPELLWTNDIGTSRYWRNNANSTFTDITAASGTGLDADGMGAAFGDFNLDGRPDWYVTSIYTDTQVTPTVPGTGNMLYMNNGNHSFTESSLPTGVKESGWGWGTVAIDFDHNGREDLIATNGWDIAFWNGLFLNDPTYLFLQNAPMQFDDLAGACGINHTGQGRGLVTFDYDNDGDQDVVIFVYTGTLTLYRNDLTGPTKNWLRVFLDTSGRSALAAEGIGARVIVNPASNAQYRWITAGANYLGNSERSAHFGLVAQPSVSLRIEWPNGTTSEFFNVGANQTIRVRACEADADSSGTVGVNDLFLYLDRWFAQTTSADVDFSRVVDLDDLWRYIDAWFAGCS